MVRCPAQGLLKDFIAAKGLSQVDAARQLDLPPSALNQYLQKKQRPRSDIRQRIARWSGGAIPEDAWLSASERRGIDDQGAAVVPNKPAA